LTTNYELM